jgi:hypothetical protein
MVKHTKIMTLESPQPRPIHVLLQVLLDNQNLFKSGLCFWTYRCFEEKLLSYDERCIVEKHIKQNPPLFYKYFKQFFKEPFHSFYWKENKIAPRIKWLDEQIKKTFDLEYLPMSIQIAGQSAYPKKRLQLFDIQENE